MTAKILKNLVVETKMISVEGLSDDPGLIEIEE
jgi:hypothetical protein